MKVGTVMRLKIGEYVLRRQVKRLKRMVKSCNINEASTIGVLFNATHSVSFDIVKDFVKEISGKSKNVMVLGFVDSKQLIDHYLYRKGFEFFTQNDLNWFDKPQNEAVTNFTSQKFDILINLNLEDSYPIKYILALSKASFKVGQLTQTHQYHDFMIDIMQEKAVMKDIQSELLKDQTSTKSHRTNFDNIADEKTSVELEMNFLINQLLHYLSKLK